VLGAIAVALAWCAFLVRLITPAWVASPEGLRLAVDGQDRELRVTSLALGLARHTRLDGPRVFLFGASDFREALNSRERLEQLLPPGTQVYDLYSNWQSLIDTAALLEKLPPHPQGLSVVMVGPKRIAHGITYEDPAGVQPPFHRNFGFRSEVREELAAREGVRTSPRSDSLLVENFQFYLPRIPYLVGHAFGEPPGIANHGWTEVLGGRLGPAGLERQRAELRRVLAGYEQEREGSFWMLERILDLAARREGRVVLLEAPFSPYGREFLVGEQLGRRYRAEMTAFADEHGVPYLDLNPELRLEQQDYWDDQHLLSKRARTAFTDALARALTPLIELPESSQ
jgi:hypothetical protein